MKRGKVATRPYVSIPRVTTKLSLASRRDSTKTHSDETRCKPDPLRIPEALLTLAHNLAPCLPTTQLGPWGTSGEDDVACLRSIAHAVPTGTCFTTPPRSLVSRLFMGAPVLTGRTSFPPLSGVKNVLARGGEGLMSDGTGQARKPKRTVTLRPLRRYIYQDRLLPTSPRSAPFCLFSREAANGERSCSTNSKSKSKRPDPSC